MTYVDAMLFMSALTPETRAQVAELMDVMDIRITPPQEEEDHPDEDR